MKDLPVSIRGQFKRSVDLVRDFHDASGIDGYIVTPTAQKVLRQIGASLQGERPERSWTLTGPYGGGKSAFALFASHIARGNPEAIHHLRKENDELAASFESLKEEPLCPVLVGGARKPLNTALLEGLAAALPSFAEQVDADEGTRAELLQLSEETEEAARQENLAGETTLDFFLRASRAVQSSGGDGLFIVIDELGKLLEYAALHPDRGDIFVLQQLAERAARTVEENEPSIFLTTILHQSFERYASNLDQTQREEWQKVQGRFEDIAYVEPADATLQLLANAVQVDRGELSSKSKSLVDGVVAAAQLPKRFDMSETRELLYETLPLHPLVSLLVGPLFRRLAQNERSLFAFLSSSEPNGFLDVMAQAGKEASASDLPLYRLDHLYDYLMTTLGATLFNQNTSKLWAETEAALGRMKDVTPLSQPVLKQIALLNFAGEMAGLEATTDLICSSMDAPTEDVEKELSRLIDERVIAYRKYSDSYIVWQGSDIDIEEEVEKARAQVSPDVPLADLLTEVVPPSPVAAHRHSYETGTTRVFEVLYSASNTWEVALESATPEADGYIVYVLPDRDIDRQELVETLESEAEDPLLFFAVPEGVSQLRDIVYELKCLQWVGKNVEKLNGDATARRELRERQADLEQRVDASLSRLLVADESGRNPCIWIHDGNMLRIEGQRDLQSLLSKACDEVFPDVPEIWNELLNLREPSPSAVRGQKKLLEAMTTGNEEEGRAPDKNRLGIEGTPAEYGLYASIVEATGMHREEDDGTWYFTHPYKEEKPGCYAVWKRIEDCFREASGKPVTVDTFFEVLAERPYGMREGLTPVFLFAYFKANEDEIAFYENGTFLQQIDYGMIERLLKTPSKFEMQQVTIEGPRRDVLEHLAPLVGLADDNRKPLPVVLRILREVHGLPPYVRKTSRMSEEALAVREALYRATDPTTLLFDELPGALNTSVDSFLSSEDINEDAIQSFVTGLQQALREITRAYDQLIREIQDRVAKSFQTRADTVEEQRHEIAERAQALEPHVSDDSLKSFVIRATNEMMDTQAWYESIATLLAGKPPVKWLDDDLDRFNAELVQTARKFRNREPLVFENGSGTEDRPENDQTKQAKRNLIRIRLGITTLGEDEQETVVQIQPDDQQTVDQLADELQQTLESVSNVDSRDTQIDLAALGKLIQRLSQDLDTSLTSELEADLQS